jgi:chlorite dismutase
MADETSLPPLDLRERGAPVNGTPQFSSERLFMQLLVLSIEKPTPTTAEAIGSAVADRGAPVVVYEDVNHPNSFGVLTFSTDPLIFTDRVRPALNSLGSTHDSVPSVREEMTMLGRTYSTGYESDLPFWLLRRPAETVMNPAWNFAVWYPLRRSGAFEKLEPREKGAILREHGEIGKRYGAQDLAHDVRLACHGLDANDNEFVIGLIGEDLYPLSHVVQQMRGTRQTSEFINQMGPFFVGRARYRASPSP